MKTELVGTVSKLKGGKSMFGHVAHDWGDAGSLAGFKQFSD